MFGSRRRELEAENHDLRARIARLVEQLDDAREENATLVAGAEIVSRQLDDARSNLAAHDRMIRAQQDKLDDLLGLNDPAVLAGAGWQECRPDKPKPPAPGREPGVAS